jgi:hypothetical protein
MLLAYVLLGTSASHADRGVGINISRIEVTERLAQGGDYSLSTFAVINTGDEPAEYEVTIRHLASQVQHRPESDWFDFEPRHFELQPGDLQNVSVRLEIPSGADTGDYYAQVHAEIVTAGTGNSVAVAAAAPLSFTVKPAGWFAAQRLRISRFLRDLEPWTYVVEGALLVTVAGYLIVRYSPYRLVRKR